jgi:nucleotide-binding universal stress UspA family protein
MTRNIMVPLDGTRFAEAALPHAMQIAKRDGATLHLVIVWPPLPAIVDTAEWIQQLEEWENTRRAEDRAYIGEMARRVGDVLGTEVLAAYLSGQPEDELASWAMQEKIDLIVMATHGHGSIGRAWLGSVADRMVRKGNVPVMLIRPSESKPDVQLTPRRPFQKILIPLDGSLLAERALRKSLLVGGGAAAPEITLLTVVGFPIPMVTRGGDLRSVQPDHLASDRELRGNQRLRSDCARYARKRRRCTAPDGKRGRQSDA